jgi:hypothetical protein
VGSRRYAVNFTHSFLIYVSSIKERRCELWSVRAAASGAQQNCSVVGSWPSPCLTFCSFASRLLWWCAMAAGHGMNTVAQLQHSACHAQRQPRSSNASLEALTSAKSKAFIFEISYESLQPRGALSSC